MNVDPTTPPKQKEPAAAAKKSGFCCWVPAAVFLIGLFSIVLLLGVNRINARTRLDDLITAALMDVQIKAAIGHLWLEEAVSGDDTADEALAEMAQAIRLIDVILHGGESEHGLLPEPLPDPEWRNQAEALRSRLVNFEKLAQERLRNIEKAGSRRSLISSLTRPSRSFSPRQGDWKRLSTKTTRKSR